MKFAEGNGYDLFKAYNNDKTENPSQSVYQLFQNYNNEIIWASSKTFMYGLTANNELDLRCTPRDIFNRMAGIGVVSALLYTGDYNKEITPVIVSNGNYNNYGLKE